MNTIVSPDFSASADRLSGLVVGQLGPGEQFVLWALRQRLRDEEQDAPSPPLLRGFRLAFGLTSLEPALAAFEGLFRVLRGSCGRDVGLLPLRCACVSAGERALLGLVAAAQAGEELSLEVLAGRLVEPAAAGTLCDGARACARVLRRADLALTALSDEPPARASSALH
jgi:hypothetical protein